MIKNLKEIFPELKDYYYIDETGEFLYSDFSKRDLSNSQLNKGYIYNDLRLENGTTKKYYRHQLVASYFIKNENNKPYVNHIDGNKLNNDISNLEWVTPQENTLHAYKNKLIDVENKSGMKASNRKLNEEDVKMIYIMSKYLGMKSFDLAEKYNITQGMVRTIRSEKTWVNFLNKVKSQIVFND